MLCLIVAYKSHRQDQRLESFVWGRPFVTTSVKIAGAQHRHLRRGAAVSATTGRVGSGSLSNGSCARICGNQSHNPQKPTAKEYGKQKTCKQHANNHEQIKGASYTLIEWVCPSGCWRCLCADLCRWGAQNSQVEKHNVSGGFTFHAFVDWHCAGCWLNGLSQ